MTVRGVYNVNNVDIRIGDITLPKTARLVTQYNATGLNPLDYYNIFDVADSTINGGMLLMSTLAVVSENLNMLEGCFHFYVCECCKLFCIEWMLDNVGYDYIESIICSISRTIDINGNRGLL